MWLVWWLLPRHIEYTKGTLSSKQWYMTSPHLTLLKRSFVDELVYILTDVQYVQLTPPRWKLRILNFSLIYFTVLLHRFLYWFSQRQEAILDTLFWNVTLRSHTTAISTIETAKQSKESDFVFSEGLVALSLNGNNITEVGIGYLRSALHSNHWFLGEKYL